MMPYSYRGMGITNTQIVQSSVPTAIAVAATFDPEPISKVALLIGAAVAGPIIGLFAGCGQTCVISTQIVEKIEPLMLQNLQAFQALPNPTQSQQAAALAGFDQLWSYVVQNCSNAQLADAGQRCITDRQAGSCKWTNANGCWNWFIGYRDPIANATNVVPDSVAAIASVSSLGTSLGLPSISSSGSPLFLVAGAAALLWAVAS